MPSLDRCLAASTAVVVALLMAVAIGSCGSSAAPKPKSDRLALAEELAGLANRGVQTPWLVTFAFTRTNTAGNQLHETLVSANRPPIEADEGLGSLAVTTGKRTYSCTQVGNHPQCLASSAPTGTSQPGAVYGGAVVSRRYDISRVAATTIAGLTAHCFALRLHTGTPLAGLGFVSEQCYSPDGVPLRSSIERAGGTDTRVALTVRTAVSRSDLLALLSPYGLARLLPAP